MLGSLLFALILVCPCLARGKLVECCAPLYHSGFGVVSTPKNVITMRRIIFTPAPPPSHPKIGKLIGEIAPMYQIFSPSSLFVSPLALKGFNGRNRSVASK